MASLEVIQPSLLIKPTKPRPEGLERLVRKFDPVERDFRNRALGRAGEELVLHAERRRLETETSRAGFA